MSFTFVTCDNAFLILKRGDTVGDDWTIPGGTPERGETSLQAAIRELAEEAGFFCQDTEQYQHPKEFHSAGKYPQSELKLISDGRFSLYTLRVAQDQKNVPAARMNLRDKNSDSNAFEHVDFKWVTLDEAENYVARYILFGAEKALHEGAKYSLKTRLL